MVGIDEVGRGCLAGPLLVVAARQSGSMPRGVADSKVLTRGARERIFIKLVKRFSFGEGWVSAAEIDEVGLANGLRLGVGRALEQLGVLINEEVIMDGPINYVPEKFKTVRCVIDADVTIPLVSAASIYAKVSRDRFMRKLSKIYPGYGFENHVGYSTAAHRQALLEHGSIETIHRMSFSTLADNLL